MSLRSFFKENRSETSTVGTFGAFRSTLAIQLKKMAWFSGRDHVLRSWAGRWRR